MGIETFWYAAPIFEKPDKCPDWCAISAKNAGLVPPPYILTCSRRMFRAAGTRMPWHPVPSRAALAILAVSACLTCSRLMSFYKVATLDFDCSFWLHQGGIPRCTWGFYCCLAAHQRTKEMDSAEPLSSILWTLTPHPGGSAAAGHVGCRGLIPI